MAVVVNGLTAPVANGQFSMVLPLAEGPNTVAATAMPVNSQRCQPDAPARNENAAPVLCTRTTLKKLVT